MDDVPLLFVNAVLHCLNSESLSTPRLLAHRTWSGVAEEHHRKRKDYAFWLTNSVNIYQITMQHLSSRSEGYTDPEQWLRNDKTHLRVRELWFGVILSRNAPEITLEEALQWSLRMAPYLTDLDEIVIIFHLGGANKSFDFLWKRPCHKLGYYNKDVSVLRWHLENNDRLERIDTNLFSCDEVLDLLPLCAEKRLTWKMEFGLCTYNLNSVKTWQGDVQWDGIYPLVTNKNTYVEPDQPEKGTAFCEDEHIRKEFLWSSRNESSFTITWK
uniref:F-box domain-containing protein n=1 Tax=Steinernema glaseri TaxID=37863 RepID=A0A1I7Y7X6_9BILA